MNAIRQLIKALLVLFLVGRVLPINAEAVKAGNFRYHYISLMPALSQVGLDVFAYPAAIDEQGKVYIVALDANFNDHLVVYEDGKITELPKDGFFFPADGAVNQKGTLGGVFRRDGSFEAAIYEKNKINILPKLAGEESSVVRSINDANKILIESWDPVPVNVTYRLYKNGQTFFSYKLNGSNSSSCWGLNNKDQVSGCFFDQVQGAFRALRFSPPNYKQVVLMPALNDKHSDAFGINNKGDVIGFSHNDDGLNNHIGIWDSKGNFTTYFEGILHSAHFNDSNLVVLSETAYGDPNSYLIPKPGLLLKLDELPDNKSEMLLPIRNVTDINNRGDMIGLDCGGDCAFILKRF